MQANPLSNQKGSILQSLIAGAVLIIGGSFIVSQNFTSKKLSNTVENKAEQSVFYRQVSDVLSSAKICEKSLSKIQPLGPNQMNLPALFSKDNIRLFGTNDIVSGKKITSMKLSGYIPQSGVKFSQITLSLETLDEDQLSQKAKKVFSGGSGRSVIKLNVLTNDNNVISCSSDQSGNALSAFETACTSLGGNFDSSTFRCKNLHGNNGMLVTYIRQYLCHEGGGGCSHPYAGKICSQGNNWVLKGYKTDGSLDCLCIPYGCADPSTACTGTPLGDNGCGVICPSGNNDALCVATTSGTTTGGSTTGGTTTGGTTSGTTGTTSGGTTGGNLTWFIACFEAGTLVTMNTGETKPIEKIAVGELVRTFDEVTGDLTVSPVSKVFHHEPRLSILYDIELSDGRTVTSNDVHLVYVSGLNRYMSVRELHQLWINRNDINLVSDKGLPVRIVSFMRRISTTRLYNLHVMSPYDQLSRDSAYGHNYFAGGMLVHNEKAESTLANVMASKAGTCCSDSTVIESYPRHAFCSGTQAEKDAYYLCLYGD